MDKDRIDLKDYTANLNADIPARTCVAYISTDTVDEEGEVVLPSGIQTNRFKSTGTVFWNHDYADPVATCEWLEMTDRGVVASTYFPERPEATRCSIVFGCGWFMSWRFNWIFIS